MLLLANAEAAAARDFRDFRVRHFGDDVLPQLSVGDICGDNDGFLWMVTQMGLVRFDGQHFKVFTPENTPGMMTARGIVLFSDKNNSLFFADANAVLYKVSRNGLQKRQELHPGVMFTLTGYPRYMPFWDNGVPGSIIDVRRFKKNAQGAGSIQVKYFTRHDTVTYHRFDTSVGATLVIDGHLIVIDRGFLASVYYPGKRVRTGVKIEGDILRNPLFKDPSAFDRIYSYGRKGHPYFIFGNSFYKLSLTGNSIVATTVIENITIPGIVSFYADERNGYYAVGTSNSGLYILSPKNFSVKLLHADSYDNAFNGVEHVSGTKFISAKGSYIFDLFSDEQMSISKWVGSFSLFREGKQIWLSVFDSIDVINVDDPTHLTPYKQLTPGSEFLQAVRKDHFGRHWIASQYALHVMEKDSIKWIRLKNVGLNAGNGIVIETIHFRDTNTLWIACRQSFISYDINTGKEAIVPEMMNKYVRNMVDDKDGGIWLLTYGNGYFYYKNGKFIKLPLDAKRYLGAVHTMLLDKNGYRWMSTNRGLFRVSNELLHRYIRDTTTIIRYEYFDKESGFLTNEFNGGFSPAGYVYLDSLFLLSSMNGLVYFDPLKIKTPPLDNKIFVDEVLINGIGQKVKDRYRVPADFKSFYCECSSPYFGSSENQHLEYKIDGVADEWQALIDNRYIRFNRIPHGDYTIRIRKPVDFLAGKTQEIVIGFVVARPWYLQVWFLGLCIGTFIAIVWTFVQLRLRLLRRQKNKLELQVKDRTTMLASSLDQLRTTVDTLEKSQADLYRSNHFKEQLTSIVLHDIQTPIRFLKRVVKHVGKIHKTMQPEELEKELDDLYYSTSEVSTFAEDFLVWIKSQKETFETVAKNVVLYNLLEEIGSLYQKIVANTGNSITIQCSDNIQLFTDPALLSIVIRNLIDNAVKYTPSGTISISALQDGQNIIIRVSDTGIGMKPDQVGRILNDDKESAPNIASGKLGYQFIKDMLRVLNGTLMIESKPGKGTTVSLLLPVS